MKTLDKPAKGSSVAVAAVRVTSLCNGCFFQLKATVTFWFVSTPFFLPASAHKGGKVSVVAWLKLGSNSFTCFQTCCVIFSPLRVIRDETHYGNLTYLVSEARLSILGREDHFDPRRLWLTVNEDI